MDTTEQPTKKRGRPPGVRNKPKQETPERLVPPSSIALEDFKHSDINTMCARQLTLLDWAQQAMRNEMKAGFQAKGEHISESDVEKLLTLSSALVRAVDALKKADGLADELSKRMTPEQLLEAALKKIEGQDVATLNYAISRLRAYRQKIAPVMGIDTIKMGDRAARTYEAPATAVDAIASLVDE